MGFIRIFKNKREKIKIYFSFILYLFINSLFIIKYSSRQDYLSEFVVVIAYITFVILFFSGFKNKRFLNKEIRLKNLYKILTVLVFISILLINIMIDSNRLQVDRWSAMEITIESIINGVYPYDKCDHLGQTSSNLPGLSLLGFPFYFFGDVGYLQVFVFLVFSIWITFSRRNEREKFLILVMLLLSPAYWWEVFVKSDLMSNILLVIIFIDFWKNRYAKNSFQRPILLGMWVGFFCLTRGIVLIPLVLMLFSEFKKSKPIEKVKFFFGFTTLFVLLTLPILQSLEDFHTVTENNPFNHQTKYAPKLLIIVTLVVPFFLSRKFKYSEPIFRFSLYILSTLLITIFMMNVIEEGIYKNIYEKAFDLSYLGMMIAFVVFSLSDSKSQNDVVETY